MSWPPIRKRISRQQRLVMPEACPTDSTVVSLRSPIMQLVNCFFDRLAVAALPTTEDRISEHVEQIPTGAPLYIYRNPTSSQPPHPHPQTTSHPSTVSPHRHSLTHLSPLKHSFPYTRCRPRRHLLVSDGTIILLPLRLMSRARGAGAARISTISRHLSTATTMPKDKVVVIGSGNW